MRYVQFEDAEIESPAEGWRRAGLSSSESVSVDWFQKPAGHVSELHGHPNEQIFVILDGEFILYTEEESVQLGRFDSAWVDANERHYSENPGETPTIGLNIFSPGREFPYWQENF